MKIATCLSNSASSLETLLLILQNKKLIPWAINNFIMHWEEFFEAVYQAVLHS